MTTVKIDATFILAAANLEMSKANKACEELNHLATTGYLNSQNEIKRVGARLSLFSFAK